MAFGDEISQTQSASAPSAIAFRFVGDADIAATPQVDWALGELSGRLRDLGVALRPWAGAGDGAEVLVSFALGLSPEIERVSRLCEVALPEEPEAFAILRGAGATADHLHVYGADLRGLIYAITELADRAALGGRLPWGRAFPAPVVGKPATPVRSISRCFESDVEDLGWFHDRDDWRAYLTHLATQRLNRIALTFGMQYNYPYGNEFISDVYFYFAYPFLVSPPGHDVEISNLTEQERRRNLETLKFIAKEADRRGLEFQLALWTQGYDFDDCPNANHQISGLSRENLAEYCRDSLAMILAEVPEITGLTLRVHVECGIPEGDYAFWRTYFEAVTSAGREIRLDLHAKGIDQELIDIALATGMPVTVSAKYTSEHMGLPYHQASIRPLELPSAGGSTPRGVMNAEDEVLYAGPDAEKHAGKWRFSEGERKFMRYSYGDLLREDRPYDLMYRIWPGTARVLLWGDAALAGGYALASTYCGAKGVELCEPLSFKGRMGTGLPGGRTGYKSEDPSEPSGWRKFAYTYRVWGRSLYDPHADPDAFRRALAAVFGEAAQSCERAIGCASRILPLITLAHTPTASNNSYWPELYENMSIVHEAPKLPYGYELPKGSRFGTVDACDPQLFLSPRDFAAAMREGRSIRKLAPLTWANRLSELAAGSGVALAHAAERIGEANAGFERFRADVAILGAVGRFFAEKIRAAVFWEYHLLSGSAAAARLAVERYRDAAEAWRVAAEVSRDLYVPDITYGPHSWLRGRWDDRLPAIERDIADMAEMSARAVDAGPSPEAALVEAHLELIRCWTTAQRHPCEHRPPERLTRGADLAIACAPFGAARLGVTLHYRHTNQAEPWRSVEMQWSDGAYRAAIPGEYANSPFPLQYYFEIDDDGCAKFWPGLVDNLSNTPYFTLTSRGSFQ